MLGRCAQRCIVGSLALLLLLPAWPARSGAQEPALQRADAPPEAKEHFDRGRSLFRAGRYREAIVELKTALELDPGSPVLMYNVAYTSELQGDLRQAVVYYRRYLAALPRSATEERRRTRTTLRRLDARREQVADGSEDDDLGVADTWFWVALGGGAVLLGGAAVTGVMALEREDRVAGFVAGPDGTVQRRETLADEADQLALASDLLLGGGAALVATAAALFFLRDDSEPVEPAPKGLRSRPKKRAPRASVTTDGRGALLLVQAEF